MLTAAATIEDRVDGLRLGADVIRGLRGYGDALPRDVGPSIDMNVAGPMSLCGRIFIIGRPTYETERRPARAV
jgi:hypothetical protein